MTPGSNDLAIYNPGKYMLGLYDAWQVYIGKYMTCNFIVFCHGFQCSATAARTTTADSLRLRVVLLHRLVFCLLNSAGQFLYDGSPPKNSSFNLLSHSNCENFFLLASVLLRS